MTKQEPILEEEPVRQRSAAAEVQAKLQANIEAGLYRQNNRLPSESELARHYGVSRPVIREALTRLHALGLTASQTGKGTFVETSLLAGATFQLLEVSRGAAFGDLDNDGDIDTLITNNNGPARLLLNQVGNRNHWLGLRLIGKDVKRDMLGAQVEIVISKDRTLWRRVRTDGSYLSANDPRVVAGLGEAVKVEAVRVRWPGGTVDEWKDLRVDQYTTLREGANSRKK